MKMNRHGFNAAETPPMSAIAQQTEPTHIGRTARMPGKGHRRPVRWRTNVITWGLVVASIATFVLLAASKR